MNKNIQLQLWFSSPRLEHTIKANCMEIKTFLKKGWALASPPYFAHVNSIN